MRCFKVGGAVAVILGLACEGIWAQNAWIEAHNNTLEALKLIPECTQKCFIPALPELNCNITTTAALAQCLCNNVKIQSQVSGCVMKTCNSREQIETALANQALCEGYHIESRSHQILKTVVIVSAVSFPFVFLRIWSRLRISGFFGVDDWAMLVAAGGVVAIMILEIQMSIDGWGNHVWTLDVTKLPLITKLFYITQLFYILIQCATKLSILLFYLRIFPQKWFLRSTIATIVLVILSDVIFLFIVAFQCNPISSLWDKSLTQKSCLNPTSIIYSGASISILEHVIILLLPIPCVHALKVGRGKRISLFIMFSIGTFALVAALVRLRYVGKFGDSTDAPWDNGDVEIWSVIEVSVALICACLPALRPLLARYIPVLFGSNATGGNSSGFMTTPNRARSRHNRDSLPWDGGDVEFGSQNLTRVAGAQGVSAMRPKHIPITIVEKPIPEDESHSHGMERDDKSAYPFPPPSPPSYASEAGTPRPSGNFDRRLTVERGRVREVVDPDVAIGSTGIAHVTKGSVGASTRWSDFSRDGVDTGSGSGSEVELVNLEGERRVAEEHGIGAAI